MKSLIKDIIYILALVAMLPVTLLYLLLNRIVNSDSLFTSFSQFLSLFPGVISCYLRAGFYRFAMTYCHPNVRASFLVLFSHRDTEIAEDVYIGPQCNIGKCKIETGVLLGSGVHIMSGKDQHNFSSLDIPIKDQGGTFKKVVVGEHSWVGNGTLIMANVGKRCVVAAGSVVVNDIEDYSIVAGNPAKVVKKLNVNE